MNPRAIAALLLALLLPVQGLAAACAQLCFKAQAQHAMAATGDADAGHDCHGGTGSGESSVPADGKCCHGHTFIEPPSVAFAASPPAFQPLAFVARWTSYIPEEPSPPPIASAG